MQVIIFHNENNGVSIVTPTPEFANQIELVAQKDVPKGRAWRIVNENDLPSRDFRDRWVWTVDGPLGVAMPSQEELDAAKAELVRSQRDHILVTEVDPVVTNPLRWAELTSEEQSSWISYRRALLDVPSQSGFPHAVVWPVRQTAPSIFSRDISRW